MSYGPCQFPTLGFIVERYDRIQKFESEKCWTIIVQYDKTQAEKEKLKNDGQIDGLNTDEG